MMSILCLIKVKKKIVLAIITRQNVATYVPLFYVDSLSFVVLMDSPFVLVSLIKSKTKSFLSLKFF